MDWCIKEQGYNKEKIEFFGSKFSIGNGYMGYRGTLEEYTKEQLTACTLSEVFDDNGNGWREPVNVPNGAYTYVVCDGEKLSVLETEIKEHVQELYIDCGLQRRSTEFVTKTGKVVKIEAERFASIDNYHLLPMRYQVTADQDAEIVIYTGIDRDVWNLSGDHFAEETECNEGNANGILCKTIQDAHMVAVGQQIKMISGEAAVTRNGYMLEVKASVKVGETVSFEKYIAVCKDTDCKDVWASVVENCEVAEASGFDALLEKQKERWAKRYENLGFKIKGDAEAEQAIYYSCYLLYSSAPEHTDRVAIPARGLSGQVYKGAMFWDTELYMLPMFAYCAPKIAKNLMMYRVYNLEGAREKAREYGHRGAFYPWESQENGKDGCTHYNLTDIFTGRKMRTYFRDKQIHISADVAYGIWKYVSITKDMSILLEGGAEVILECARFFNSYSYYKRDKDRYEFLDVTGADEYHERVNNDAYTNYMIYLNAKIALEVMDYLDKNHHDKYVQIMDELDYWDEVDFVKDMYEKIYLPKPNEGGVIEQFDGYFKEEDLSIEELYSRIIKPNEYLGSPCGLAVNTQIIKQADVILLLSLLGEQFEDLVKEQNWSYYEPRTEHGSSLSTCIYALLAAKIGKTEWAYKFLMKAAQIDLIGNYKLYLGDLYIGGTHPAANGGTWMVTVQGFAGLEASENGVLLNPHHPEKWETLEFAFQYAGYQCKAVIEKDVVKVNVVDGPEGKMKIYMGGNEYFCGAGETVEITY